MRKDMFKVIVERPRGARSWATKSKLRYDKCPERSRVTGHRLVTEHTGHTKYLNENLAPLRRYLGKQIGRNWDKVFSEICETLDTGSTVKMHVREHIDDYVQRHVKVDGQGRLYVVKSSYWHLDRDTANWRQDYYVDPKTRQLRCTLTLYKKLGFPNSREIRSQRFKPEDMSGKMRWLDENQLAICLRGIWYELKLSGKRWCNKGYILSDADLYERLRTTAWRDQTHWTVAHKAQMSGKRLKALKLKNKV